MKKQEIKEIIIKLAENIRKEHINEYDEDMLNEKNIFGFDTLDWLDLLVRVDRKFDINIDIEKVGDKLSINSLTDLTKLYLEKNEKV